MRTILLTGATRGLGRAMVDGFISAGHRVIGCGRSDAEVKRLRSRHPSPNDFYVVDVASDDEVKSWASLVLTACGTPDLVLNNAALINRNAPLWDIGAEEFSRVVDVNIKGVANVIRHFVPSMVRERRGVVVNFSSGWGRSADAEVGPYCATKWAVEGMTKSLARELPEGMAAVALNPGVINTDMLRSCFGRSASTYPTPEQWAQRAVPFLLRLGAAENGESATVPG